jgi:hypothetical protein
MKFGDTTYIPKRVYEYHKSAHGTIIHDMVRLVKTSNKTLAEETLSKGFATHNMTPVSATLNEHFSTPTEDAIAIYDEWETIYGNLIKMTTEEYEQHKTEIKKYAKAYERPAVNESFAMTNRCRFLFLFFRNMVYKCQCIQKNCNPQMSRPLTRRNPRRLTDINIPIRA